MSIASISVRPKSRFIKAIDIQTLFEITKKEYNDILVRIIKITLNNFI